MLKFMSRFLGKKLKILLLRASNAVGAVVGSVSVVVLDVVLFVVGTVFAFVVVLVDTLRIISFCFVASFILVVDFDVFLDVQFTDEPITMTTLHLVVCFDHRSTKTLKARNVIWIVKLQLWS